MPVTLLLTPRSPRLGVADDGAGLKSGVEVQRDVLRIMADVEGEAAVEDRGQKCEKKRGSPSQCQLLHY